MHFFWNNTCGWAGCAGLTRVPFPTLFSLGFVFYRLQATLKAATMLQEIIAIAQLTGVRLLQVARVLGCPPMLCLPSALLLCHLCYNPASGCLQKYKKAEAAGNSICKVSAVRVPQSLLCQSACSTGWGVTFYSLQLHLRESLWLHSLSFLPCTLSASATLKSTVPESSGTCPKSQLRRHDHEQSF